MIIPAVKQMAMELYKQTYVQRIWEHMGGEMFINMRTKEPRWPRCVFFPSPYLKKFQRTLPRKFQAHDVGLHMNLMRRRDDWDSWKWNDDDLKAITRDQELLIQSLGIWTFTQGIYVIDENLLEQIWQPYTGVMSENVIRLPEWCTYIQLPRELPGLVFDDESFEGILVWLDWDIDDLCLILRARPFYDYENPLPFSHSWQIKVRPGETVEQAIAEQLPHLEITCEAQKAPITAEQVEGHTFLFQRLLSVISYIGDRTADYQRRTSLPRPRKTIRGAKFPEIEPVVYHVGSVLGPVLGYIKKKILDNQKQSSGNNHGGVPLSGPSVTRAHRQGYHVIQEDGTQKLEDRWKFPYFRGFIPDDWIDRPVILRKVMQVQPSLCKKYPKLAVELGVSMQLPRLPNLYARIEEKKKKKSKLKQKKISSIQTALQMNRKGDFTKKKKKKKHKAQAVA